MTEAIWVAIIGAAAVVAAAVIGLFKKSDKAESKKKATVNQSFNVSGNHNTVVGIKNDKKEK